MLCDEEWLSWNCVIGFPVQGIWRECEDGTDVNAVDRSNGEIFGQKVLARADDFGKISLLKYPCIVKGSEY